MLGNLITGFIVILVGATLAPTVATEVQGARTGNGSEAAGVINVTGAASTVLGLVTLFYCMAVMATGIGIATVGLRQAGLM